MTDLDFEVRARQTNCDPSTHLQIGWHNVELFAAYSQDRSLSYVGVKSFEWFSFSFHRLFDVVTPPVLAGYSNLALRPGSAQRNVIRVTSYAEFPVETIMRFLLHTKDDVLSTYRHTTALLLRYPVILPVSTVAQKVIDQFRIFFLCYCQLDALTASMA